MRVVVTGGTGLIGSHLVEQLRADGDEVHIVSRAPEPPGLTSIVWWRADLAEPGRARELLTRIRPERVCHLAGLVDGARSLDAVLPTLHANVVATVELLDAVTRLECRRIVVAGSLLEEPTVTGDGVPGSPYGASRWASSTYSRMFQGLFGTPVVVLRPSYVYGPGQRDTSKLVPHVIRRLLADESPQLATGDRVLDWVYGADAAAAFRTALTADDVDGATIDVVSGDRRSVRDVIDELVGLIQPPTARPVYGAVAVRAHEQDVPGDPEAARALLHWSPRTDLATGLRLTVEWMRNGP